MKVALVALALLFLAESAAGEPPLPAAAAPASEAVQRFADDVRWLADGAREGRGPGTRGLSDAARFIADRFAALGLAPAYGSDFLVPFDLPLAVAVLPGTAMTLDGKVLSSGDLVPAGFSAVGTVTAPVVAAGYGIVAAAAGVDDFAGLDVRGKIVLVRRFAPDTAAFHDAETFLRYGTLRAKAWNARERGAIGLIAADLPAGGPPVPAAALPKPSVLKGMGDEAGPGDVGIPVVVVAREAAEALAAPGEHRATLTVDIRVDSSRAANVAGVVRAGAADRLPGALLIGAHYDHLGSKAAPAAAAAAVHPGADDNASGTAALLEIARRLAAERGRLRRDVYLIAFTGEELGMYGSAETLRRPPPGLGVWDLVAMLNLDMVGRLSGDLRVVGSGSAPEWPALVEPVCRRAAVSCKLGGSGAGLSDQTPFYHAGVPVLHFFTGIHADYHKPTDTPDKVNARGGAQVAGLVADLAAALANRPERPTFQPAGGGRHATAVSLGIVPDFIGAGLPGILVAGVRPCSPAARGGFRPGDRLVKLAGIHIRDFQDLADALGRMESGRAVKAVVEREGRRQIVALRRR